jgi:hypothetical protein
MTMNLVSEFFGNTHEILNRNFDKSKENTPARITDRISVNSAGHCKGDSGCKSCHNSGCNK